MTFNPLHFPPIENATIGLEMQHFFQNHWILHTQLLNWSGFPLKVIHILEKSTKKRITRTKKIVAANLQH